MAQQLPLSSPQQVGNSPLLQKGSKSYRFLTGKDVKQGETLIDFSQATDQVTSIRAEKGVSYSLTDPVTGKVIEPKKVRQVAHQLEITLQDGRIIRIEDFFVSSTTADGGLLLQAQSEYVFFTGTGATPYWVIDTYANLAEWTLESNFPIWPSQDLLGVPQWMSAQGLSASALIPFPVAVASIEAGLGSGVLGALGAVGLAGAAAGGAAGGGGSPTSSSAAPVFSSVNIVSVAENTLTSAVVYKATAMADSSSKTVTYSISGGDSALFNLNKTTGEVTFKLSPDAEVPRDVGADNIYNFTIKATDSAGLISTQAVTITVIDFPDQAPTFTSASAKTVAENISASTVLLTALARPDMDKKNVTYKLIGTDAAKFDLDTLGNLRFKVSPDHEAPGDIAGGTSVAGNNIYDLVITATEEGNSKTASQNVTITVTDTPDVPPVFSLGRTVTKSVAENFLTTAVVHDAKATSDVLGNTILYGLSGLDALLFNIDGNGLVKFKNSPDYENPTDSGRDHVYDLTITATETLSGTSTSSSQTLALTVTNVTDILDFTSGPAISVAENIASTGYTATALVDSPSVIYTYALGSGGDESLFTINASTGVLTFKNAPDYENPTDIGRNNVYDVHIVATSVEINASNQQVTKTATQTVAVTVTDVLGIQPVHTTALNGVTTLDVQSDLVINFALAVNLSTNSAIKLHVISSTSGRSFDIAITDTTQVKLSTDGKSLVINPTGDLDFGSSYHIEVDAGAFISRADPSGTPVSAANSNLATFSTVTLITPGVGVASQKMTGTGGLVTSQTYMDITGLGDDNNVNTSIDMSTGNITLVYKDGNAAGGSATTTGIGTGTVGFNLQVKNWATGDFLYFDDHTSLPNTHSANLTDSFGGLQDGNAFNTPAAPGTQVPNFVGLLQIDPGAAGNPHAWIGIGLQTPGYGGLDGNSFENSVISG